ncbi:MAG: glutaredoxin [Gammaproteobacteria bacterium]|nr:MAG: glutaredoxin [Gammaproteobacteria bacterium]
MKRMGTALILALAAAAAAAAGGDAQRIAKALKDSFPGRTVSDVRPSPITGLWAASVDGNLVYTDGRYFIQGDIIELGSLRNVTKLEVLERIRDEDTVVFPAKGETRHTLTVFTDTSCGYCRKLHQEIDKLTGAGIKVRYLLYPRAGLGSPPAKVLESVWCADDRQQALTDAKAGKQIPEKSCPNPIAQHIELAHQIGLRGTPLILTDGGLVINGYRPADDLIRMLEAQ